MKEIIFVKEATTIQSIVGISKEREDELSHEIDLLMHKLQTPVRGQDGVAIDDYDVFHGCVKLGKTEEERVALAHISGRICGSLSNNPYFDSIGIDLLNKKLPVRREFLKKSGTHD